MHCSTAAVACYRGNPRSSGPSSGGISSELGRKRPVGPVGIGAATDGSEQYPASRQGGDKLADMMAGRTVRTGELFVARSRRLTAVCFRSRKGVEIPLQKSTDSSTWGLSPLCHGSEKTFSRFANGRKSVPRAPSRARRACADIDDPDLRHYDLSHEEFGLFVASSQWRLCLCDDGVFGSF